MKTIEVAHYYDTARSYENAFEVFIKQGYTRAFSVNFI